MSRSVKSASKSSSELVTGAVLTVSPSLIRADVVELYEDENRPMILNRSLLQSPLISRYEFTHKAIWAVSLPQTNETCDGLKCWVFGKSVPNLQHWAFVARGCIPGLNDLVAYFVAQYNSDSYIPTTEERDAEREGGVKKYHFAADLVENSKRHAALLLCTTKIKTNVWVFLPDSSQQDEWVKMGDILTDPEGKLVSGEFDTSQWEIMTSPRKLRDLNELMYQTDLVGQKYTAGEKNCQMFAKSMFHLA